MIHKEITGDPAGASTDFTARVDCTGDAYDQDVALNAGNGWTNTTTSIPTGVECTLTEVDIPAGWELVSITPDKITVTKGTPAEASVVVTNQRKTGKIKIEKKITGDPTGAGTDFTVQVNCTGDAYDQDVALNAGNGWTNTTTSIPTGVECTLTEVDIPVGWELVSITPDKITVTKGTPAEASVVVTNQRKTGKIKVHKDFPAGDVAGASTDFTVHVNCPGTLYDQDVALNAGNNWTDTTGLSQRLPVQPDGGQHPGRVATGLHHPPDSVTVGVGYSGGGLCGGHQRPRHREDQDPQGDHR